MAGQLRGDVRTGHLIEVVGEITLRGEERRAAVPAASQPVGHE